MLTLKQHGDRHMTSRGFHNAHVQILPILIFHVMSSIGHLLIANTIISTPLDGTLSNQRK